MADLRKRIEEYLDRGIVMQLATAHDNKPRVCTVHFARDSELNLYWASLRTTRHSRYIAQNPAAAGSVTLDPNVRRCVHFEGEAQEVEVADLARVNALFTAKSGSELPFWSEVQMNRPDGRTFYVLKPNSMVLWDAVDFPEDPRQELRLYE